MTDSVEAFGEKFREMENVHLRFLWRSMEFWATTDWSDDQELELGLMANPNLNPAFLIRNGFFCDLLWRRFARSSVGDAGDQPVPLCRYQSLTLSDPWMLETVSADLGAVPDSHGWRFAEKSLLINLECQVLMTVEIDGGGRMLAMTMPF